MSTPLHQRMLAYWADEPEKLELNTRVWAGTPWMIDVETGSPNSEQRHDMAEWCRERFGPEAWPIHGKPGNWYIAGATVYGWTWIGFATEAQMREFAAAFPAHVREPAVSPPTDTPDRSGFWCGPVGREVPIADLLMPELVRLDAVLRDAISKAEAGRDIELAAKLLPGRIEVGREIARRRALAGGRVGEVTPIPGSGKPTC